MSPLQIAALLEAGIRLFTVINGAVKDLSGTLSIDELRPLQAQLDALHDESLALSAQLDATAALAALPPEA